MNRASVVLLGVLIVATAGHAVDPYVVTIDLRADIAALGDEDGDVSYDATARLVALGDVVLPALAAALAGEPAPVRTGVVDVLRQLKAPQAAALLVQATADRDAAVRADAVMALGLTNAAAGAAAVERALGDPDASVRRAAIAACSRLCTSPQAIDTVLTAALRDPPGNPATIAFVTIALSPDSPRAAAAHRAVEARVVPLLAADVAAPQRLQAALLLAALGDARAIAALRVLLGDPRLAAARPQMAMALSTLREPAAVEALRELAADPALRPLVCQALANLASQQVAGATPCP
ncbi:MAG: HEAT repeat domain-containing protein [Deltaproteobacteria bacterium]|nr:HEAT repeat domain-containing protein [Deltaproteobacteria bacterium]